MVSTISRRIDVARSSTWFICTDASTTIGGVGWLSVKPHPRHSGDLHDVFFLRWSPNELLEFQRLSLVIHTGIQNLVNSDTTSLFQVSMIGMTYGIQLVPFYIPWVDNHLADILSCHPDCYEDPDVIQLSATIASFSLPSAEFIAMVTSLYYLVPLSWQLCFVTPICL